MTTEEAIDRIQDHMIVHRIGEAPHIKLSEALNMAISALRAQKDAPKLPEFSVIDTKTGAYPDVGSIALNEEWAKGLVYCDIDCFAVQEDGNLILIDDCGNIAYPPAGRFQVVFADEAQRPNAPLTLDELLRMDGEPVWIVEYPDWGHWELSVDADDYVADREPSFYGMKHDDPAGRYGLHKLGWLAYRRKPEEGTK